MMLLICAQNRLLQAPARRQHLQQRLPTWVRKNRLTPGQGGTDSDRYNSLRDRALMGAVAPCESLLPPGWPSAGTRKICTPSLNWLIPFVYPTQPTCPGQSLFQGLQSLNTSGGQPQLTLKSHKALRVDTSSSQPGLTL